MKRILNGLYALLRLLEDPGPQTQGRIDADRGATDQETQTTRPVVATLHIPQAVMDQYAADQRTQKELEQRTFKNDRKRLWIEGATLFFVIVGVSGAFWNLYLMRDSVEVAKQAGVSAKDSAAAAKDAAVAAKTSADASVITADAAKVQAGASKTQAGAAIVANVIARENQRARLTFSVAVEQEPTVDKPNIVFRMPIVMTGTTDATKVRFTALNSWIDMKVKPDVTKQNWPANNSPLWIQANVVSTGEQNRIFRSELVGDKDIVQMYLGGTRQVGIVIRVEYCDVFQRRHYITRCAMRKAVPPNSPVTYCGVETDNNNREQGQPECQP